MRRLALLLLIFVPLAWGDRPPPEPEGFWTGPVNSPVPVTIAGGKVIHVRELAELLRAAAPLVIDVSNAPKKPAGLAPDAPWLPLPQEAIPGSHWLPGVGMGTIPPETEAFFRDYLEHAMDGKLDHPIVIYCHERCWLSWNAAKRVIGYGYRQVYWLPDGVEGWRAAGYKTEIVKPRTPASAEPTN